MGHQRVRTAARTTGTAGKDRRDQDRVRHSTATKQVLCTSETWIGRADCKHCGIRNRVLFSGLSNDELDAILEPIDVYCYPPDSVVYHEGERNDSLYTARTGLVKLVRYLADGTSRIVRLLRRGDAFGLERLIGQGYEHTAVAVTRVNVCRIPTGVLRNLDMKNPAVHRELLERWDEHLRRADDCIAFLSTGTIRKRVAYLVELLAKAGEHNPGHRVELLGREDMAAMLGVRVESLSRVIAELKRKGILRRLDDKTYAYDPQALQRYADI
jgi:CRP/FNR family transcriptional regulator